jgi:hypothetical protein
MTQDTEALKAGEVVDALFADLRDRKFLKYLFAEDPSNHGAYGYIERPFDLDVQQEIADAWRKIVTSAFSPIPDAGEVQAVSGRDLIESSALTFRDGVEAAARIADERATCRLELYEKNGGLGNAAKAIEAEQIAAAIRRLACP